MSDLFSVFDFMGTLVGMYLSTMLSHWYTTILIFIMVLGAIVAVFLATRGTK